MRHFDAGSLPHSSGAACRDTRKPRPRGGAGCASKARMFYAPVTARCYGFAAVIFDAIFDFRAYAVVAIFAMRQPITNAAHNINEDRCHDAERHAAADDTDAIMRMRAITQAMRCADVFAANRSLYPEPHVAVTCASTTLNSAR